MAKKPKFKEGDIVLYDGLPYQIETYVSGTINGTWYILKNRLGSVHETEIKKL